MLFAVLLLTSFSACSGLKILTVLPFPMKSHQIVFNTLVAELVRRGHDVTVYSNTPLVTNASNYKHVYVRSSLEDSLEKTYSYENIKSRMDVENFIRPMGFQLLTNNVTEEFLNLPQVKSLLLSDEKFDAIILETFFGQEALIGFGHRFNAPVVTLSSFGSYSLIDSVMGNPNPLAYFTTYQLPFTSELTFYQKLKNVVATLSELHYSYFHHLPKQAEVMFRHFSKHCRTPLPPLMELLVNIAVVLLNTQPEVSYARPWVPNIVSVGGYHIPKEITVLPKDIRKFIDGADDGFVYFSLGSTFSGATIPDFMNKALAAAFRQLPQRVLWKIDIPPPDLPPNVLAITWAQQVDILAEPKCRAFITHGGLLSVMEAVHFAVPLVGLPVFADQPWNLVKVEQAQIGVRLRLLNISTDSLTWALHQVLHDAKYKKNMDNLSRQMRDWLVAPMDTAVYWVEYVAKHQGAPQLRSPARSMSSFQYLLGDIVLFVLIILFFTIVVLFVLLKKIYRSVTGVLVGKTNKSNKSKKE